MVHALAAVVFAVLAWWLSTGAVIVIARVRVAHWLYVVGPAAALGIAGLIVLFVTADAVSAVAVYGAFVAALAIWAFHEITFLLGHVVGPRREPCPPDAQGKDRFRLAFAAVRDHELALFATAAVLVVLFAGATNPFGWLIFALMWLMRLMTKLNVFLGAPNAISEILPRRMDYLTSYFRTDRVHAFFIVSVAAITCLFTVCVYMAATAVSPGMIAGWSLVATFAFLGLVEHLFLVLPIRDSALWGWAVGRGETARFAETDASNTKDKKAAAPALS
ncbi:MULTISPECIES: putative photosynthetic complex assembly protein PuhE [unclassified Roseitalea]|uniref:putative photosynthetic complex assembly protein PuhE n=1 Tax=unclassified Roseitalea TaxID=2639107 RepID=UPI00273F510C|nr:MULTISPECIES: putative photosynthetic complex assembly protein PuhE [unclassified Roseitalea]